MKSLAKLLEQGPSGLVFGTSTGESVAMGYRNILEPAEKHSVTMNDSFDLASLTKIMCTTSILMKLVASKEISLDTKVSSIIPAWKYDKSEITIEHLLRHRSGIEPWRPIYASTSDVQGGHDYIANLPPAKHIDTSRVYSDLGFIALGQIISTLTSKSIVEAFDQMIARPLGLTKTSFIAPATNAISTSLGDSFEYKMVESKTPYAIPESTYDFHGWRGHVLTGEVNDGNAFHVFGGASSHAGLFSTADDILKFASAIKNDPMFRQFTEPGPDADAHLGFISWESSVSGCTDRFYGHTGFTGVVFGISSQHNSEIVLLTNRIHTQGKLVLTSEMWRPVLDEYHRSLHE
jgi:CubicO group peptidase (beta-lactamase class C family)